jgi:teichuronic acid biosynthesis glycosyltransferase TuaG
LVDSFKISVIIPNYNRSDLLKLAIESALNQTFAPLEILVCDDGSTDDSKDIVSTFDSTIVKWIDCGKNGRPAIPRNMGIRKAIGNWIAFLDNDDIWLPNKLENQVKCILKENNLTAVCSNAFRIRGSNFNERYFKEISNQIFTFNHFIYSNPVICSSVLISKNVLNQTSLFPEHSAFKAIEDYSLWMKISTTFKFYYISEPLLYYRDEIITDSIRKENKTIEEIRKIIFPDLNNWIKTNNVKLNFKNRIDVNKQLCLIKNNFKLSIMNTIRFKILYKINNIFS